MEVRGKQGEGSDLLGYVSGKGQDAICTSLFTTTLMFLLISRSCSLVTSKILNKLILLMLLLNSSMTHYQCKVLKTYMNNMIQYNLLPAEVEKVIKHYKLIPVKVKKVIRHYKQLPVKIEEVSDTAS